MDNARFSQAVSVVFKGIVASVVASFLFGAIYYLSPWLAPLAGEEIFGWRVLCTLPFTTLLLWGRGEAAQLRALAPGQRPLYGLVFAAVGLLVLDGALRLRRAGAAAAARFL